MLPTRGPALDESEFWRYRPGNGWVALSRTGQTASQTISGLIPGTAYRVRVRARNSAGVSDWVVIEGTTSGTPPSVTVFDPAPVGDVLVSNFSQRPYALSSQPNQRAWGQAFTTGSVPTMLSSIDLVASFSAHTKQLQVELWSATSGGIPSAKISDLVVPWGNIAAGETVSFGAPANTRLAANTAYSIVLYRPGNSAAIGFATTNNNNEDPGAATGWSIADGSASYKGHSPSASMNNSLSKSSFVIAVKGRLEPNLVTLSASPNPVQEGSPVTVTATLSRALSEEVRIPIAAASVANEITIAAGATTGTYVHTAGDAPDGEIKREQIVIENRRLKQMRPVIKLGDPYLVNLQVLDENADPHRVSVSDAKGWEQLRYGRLCFEFTLDRAASHEIWVGYRTENGTAIAGQDYQGVVGSPVISFAPGETRKRKCITILDDDVEDSGDTFSMVLVNPHGAILGRARGTGTIYNHEPTSLSALAAEGASGEEGPFAALDIGTFAPATTAYSATVPHGTTHARLTPKSLNPHLTITTGLDGKGKSQVPFGGGTGPAVALAVGENVLVVKTLFNGQRQTYRVTVTREAAPADVAVSLSATPNPVREGSPVTVTATLAKALEEDVTIPLTVTRGTSEDGDHGSLASITLLAGFTSVDGRISTADDADGDDETFTVALGGLPSGLVAGTASSVEVTITDSGLQRTAPLTLSGLSGSTSTDGSDFGATLDIGTFAPGTTEYAATVGNAVTHVKLTATAGEPGATLKVGKGSSLAAVADGSASGAIPLSVGANALKVEVTAEDGTIRTYAVAVTRQAAPLTAAFENVPSEHDGTAFTFDLTLSDTPGAGNLPVAASFKVAPGKASVSGSGTRYAVTVTPKAANAWKDVTITLNGGRACGEEGAICTADGRALSNTSSVTVSGPVRIRVAGAKAKEGKDATLDFAVTLNRAVSHEVSVDYATKDETATAGLDYTATSGTLVFAAGVTAKTVSVPVLDDSVDEGKEIMRLKLSNPKGAYLRGVHTKARGIITNNDPLPGAWLSRFGRTVARHHVAAIRDRLAADRSPGLSARFAGQPLPTQMRDGAAQAAGADGMKTSPETRVAHDSATAGAVLSSRTAPGDADALAETDEDGMLAFRSLQAFLAGDGDEGEASVHAVAADDVLLGTDFVMTRDAGHGLSHGFWGRAARSGFSGREGTTSVEGTVTGVLLGTDWKRKGMAFGVIVSESRGAMTYGGASSGAIDARLSALVPWAGLEIGEHSSLWGAAGIGRGDMTLRPDGQDPTVTGIGWSMAALGAEGALAPGARIGGASLGWHADALATRAESDAARTDTGNLAAGSGTTTRMRLGLRAAWQRTLASGATLSPRLEAGVRHDGGDAETGLGLEVGGGIAFADPARGLSMSMDARTLALHEDGNFKDWGLSLGLSWDPRPETKRGCSATARHGLGGASAGGVDALFGPEAFPGAPGAGGGSGWSVEAACGMGRGHGMVGSPYARASGGGEAESLRVGYRIEPDADHAEDATVQAWADPTADGGSVGAGLEWRW